MHKHSKIRLPFIFLFSFLFLGQAELAEAKITKSGCAGGKPKALVKTSKGVGAEVHPSAVSTFKCILNGLEKTGLRIVWVGGYGCRPIPTSNHPRGLGMDVNQYARDKTKPLVPRQKATQIANSCNATHGAVWRNPDAGHFEVRSQSRRQQASRRR